MRRSHSRPAKRNSLPRDAMHVLLHHIPRRVRIHGGECGAVARALHHEAQKDALMSYEQTLVSTEKQFLRQADLGKAPRSTIERKQMSTKTTLKRIALVAVSALGFGLMTTVSAVAGSHEATAVTVNAQAPFRAGVTSSIAMSISAPTGTYAGTNTNDLGAKILTAPTGSTSSALAFASRPTSGNSCFSIITRCGTRKDSSNNRCRIYCITSIARRRSGGKCERRRS